MSTEKQDYHVTQLSVNFGYIKSILHKYHKFSEALEKETEKEHYPTFIEEIQRINDDPDADIEILRDVVINQFYKQADANAPIEVLEIVKLDHLNDMERLAVNNLAMIVYQYCIHDYKFYFVRHNGKNLTDKEANDHDEFFLNRAYAVLRDLKNLLLFRDEAYANNTMTIDRKELRDIGEGKMKSYIFKENQVEIGDPYMMKKMIAPLIADLLEDIQNMLIEDFSEDIQNIPNEYISFIAFAGQSEDTITFDFVNKEFEKINSYIKAKPSIKQPSKRAVFKGFIISLVNKYVIDEKLTYNEKELDDRDRLDLAYMLLSWFGFISLDLIKSHRDKNGRVKYMRDSLPDWTGEAILPNEAQVTFTK